jgi:hypothetical protein
MTTRKIIYDEANSIFTKPERKKIKNALLLAGGGTTQTFFAMGAVACLVDNGLFDFDLITAVSGGTVLLNIIDLCYNEDYNYYKEPDWYNRYVRKNIYAISNSKMLLYSVKSGFDMKKTNDYLFQQMIDFKKELTKTNTTIVCEYNYIDAYTDNIVCDMNDIIENGKVDGTWFINQLARCSLPLSIINNRPTYDAGNIGNLPVSTFIRNYEAERVIVIKCYTMIVKDTYPKQTLSYLFANWLFNNIYVSETAMNQLLSFGIVPNPNNIFCGFSNELNPSEDPIHNKITLYDASLETRYSHGLFYDTGDIPQIIENEGYIQMYSQLKRTGEAKVFKIPNPKVYNETVVSKVAEFKQQNPWIELIKQFIMP